MSQHSELSMEADKIHNSIDAPTLLISSGMSRWRAGAIHLGFSALLVGLVLLFSFLFWTPLPYFWISGAFFIVGLLVLIDLCLGPLLTTIIFKSGKKGLKMDLILIAIVQTIALLYGAHTLYSGRIAYLVFNGNFFVMLKASEIDSNALKDAKPEYQHTPSLGFKWIGVVHEAQKNQLKNGAEEPEMFGAYLYPKYYTPIKEIKQDILAARESKDSLISLFPEQKLQIEQAVDKYVDGLFFVLQAQTGTALIVLDKNSLKPLNTWILQRY